MSLTPEERLHAFLAEYAAPDARAATLMCDRHPADAVAFTLVEPDLSSREMTFGELRERSERLAGALRALGVGPGDRVATLMGRSAELVVTLLAIWRLGAVQVPLFTAFAPPAIAMRITGNGTRVVVADADQRAKLEPGEAIPADAPWRVITVGEESDALLRDAAPVTEPAVTGGDGVLVELYTSGTTGTPKGVPIPLRSMASMRMYVEYALGCEPDDVYWNAADPGWAYGLYFAVITPLIMGRTSLLLRAPFSPELTWRVLERFGVTNFSAAPTVYRALRNSGTVPAGLRLRRCSSAGEPLTPDVVEWAERALGLPVLDHYGQTESSMIVANAWHPDLRGETRPGSMGRPLPGFAVEVLDAGRDEPAAPGERGRVAVDRTASPLFWFTGYRDAPERTAERFSADGRWYLTGDLASRDTDGYLYFGSRDDDVILMAGYRIGPFEVESVLTRHAAVAEAAVVGVPDELRGEVLVAHIVPRDGVEPDDALVAELQRLVKKELAAHAYPRRVTFVPELPKTPSGKVQRYLLRRRG
ncbi:acyl-CoA synthetase [Actinomadura kijaniata]|uniref:Acetyl-CoA synthetase n=1 Tax=Actinomadura namibiensis TaxID=182080 RepID=A0A7W3LKS5_ACTNM|nr:AMP-binding protein [Actinomadura namibiensis]MBA8949898.1 acetyl-CoA synthetase [Actinomadura namibiensis]